MPNQEETSGSALWISNVSKLKKVPALIKGRHDSPAAQGLALLPTTANNPLVSRCLLLFLLCLAAGIFTSCVEGEEEVWVNQDGSVRIVAHYELPGMAMSRLGNPDDLKQALISIDEREEGLKIQALSFGPDKVSGKIVFHLEATFESAFDLLELVKRNEQTFIEESGVDPAQIDALAGSIDFKFEDLTPKLRRGVNLGGLFPSAVSKRPRMLGPSNFKYTIHLPARVKETNAHFISDDGRTISWTFLLKEHFDAPMEMVVSTELPVPWWAWAVLALLAFGLAWLIWRFVIRRFL